MNPQRDLHLSLVSHTNVGKTTLARTLLQRDVGEVRDAPHVTHSAEAHELLRSADGEVLWLWDTPGFGDSVRLLRRMRQSANPVGWFLSQAWDRWRDRPFWASQQALRHVAAASDVVLYLANAAEEPQAAAYVSSELALLAWTGKPVIVLLNQLGAPREAAVEAAELQRWREHLAPHTSVAYVLPMDAFARCWVQEQVLLEAIELCLTDERRARMQRLARAWRGQRLQVFDAAVDAIAQHMAQLATMREEAADAAGLRARLKRLGAVLGLRAEEQDAAALAQAALVQRLDDEVRANTAALIALHGLAGSAQGEVLTRLEAHYRVQLKLDEGKAALLGGALTGALAGLKADLASGGLTLGGGLLAGGLLGALGAAGLARCVNLVRGGGRSWVAWKPQALQAMLQAALLRYLAVAHFGRGRGEWVRGETPPHWVPVVEAALVAERETLDLVWREREPGADDAAAAVAPLAAALQPPVERVLRAALVALYPRSPVPEALA